MLQRLADGDVTVYGTDVHDTVTLTTSGDGTWTASTDHGFGVGAPKDAPASAEPTPIPEPADAVPEGSSGAVEFVAVTSPVRPGRQRHRHRLHHAQRAV